MTTLTAAFQPAWRAFPAHVFGNESEVLLPQSVALHIQSSTHDEPMVYTSHLIRFAATGEDGRTILGNLAPLQVVPIWKCEKLQQGREWSLMTAVQHFVWSAVAYEGKLFAGGLTDMSKQVFSVNEFLDGKVTNLDESRLFSPGGRVMHNLQTAFPWAVPIKNHPRFENKVRVSHAMTLKSWASCFGTTEVVAGQPQVPVLVAYDDNGPLTLYDPVHDREVHARLLQMPVSMEYMETTLGLRGDQTRDLFNRVESSAMEYLQHHAGDPEMVGLAWVTDLSADGESMASDLCEPMHNLTTAQLAFCQPFNNEDRSQHLRLGADTLLTEFTTGQYVPSTP